MKTWRLRCSPPEGNTKYLGQMITLKNQESAGKEHRMWCTWSASAKHRQELAGRSYQLGHRMKLFESVITPSMMYGAGTWTTTSEHEKTDTHNAKKKCGASSLREKEGAKANRSHMKKIYTTNERSGQDNYSQDENSTNDGHDQDSSPSFESDSENVNHTKNRKKNRKSKRRMKCENQSLNARVQCAHQNLNV